MDKERFCVIWYTYTGIRNHAICNASPRKVIDVIGVVDRDPHFAYIRTDRIHV